MYITNPAMNNSDLQYKDMIEIFKAYIDRGNFDLLITNNFVILSLIIAQHKQYTCSLW